MQGEEGQATHLADRLLLDQFTSAKTDPLSWLQTSILATLIAPERADTM